MSSLEIIEDYGQIDMDDVVKMLEKQDDLIEIQRLIIQLLLLSGFLTLVLLMFLVYRLNLHFKWLTMLRGATESIKEDVTETEKPMDTKPSAPKVSTFVLAKPVLTIENDVTKDNMKLIKEHKPVTGKKTPKINKFKKSVVKSIKSK